MIVERRFVCMEQAPTKETLRLSQSLLQTAELFLVSLISLKGATRLEIFIFKILIKTTKLELTILVLKSKVVPPSIETCLFEVDVNIDKISEYHTDDWNDSSELTVEDLNTKRNFDEHWDQVLVCFFFFGIFGLIFPRCRQKIQKSSLPSP